MGFWKAVRLSWCTADIYTIRGPGGHRRRISPRACELQLNVQRLLCSDEEKTSEDGPLSRP